MNFDCSLNIHCNVNSAHVLLILLCPPQPSCLVNHGKSTKTLLSQNTHMRHGFNYGAATWCTAPHPCISLSQHNRYTHHTLSQYSNQQLVQFFLQGISEGFHIGYSYHTGSTLKTAKKNLVGARQHPRVVDEYLSNELSHNRIVGPYSKSNEFRSADLASYQNDTNKTAGD